MLKHFAFLGLFLLLFPLSLSLHAQELKTLTFDGQQRVYTLRLPENYDENSAYPLLIALHGAGDNSINLQIGTQIDELAHEFGYIAVFPDGFQQGWNFLDEEQLVQGENYTDDVGFLTALIEQVQTDYAIDSGRIFMTGYSNGGLMTIRMACELDDTLAGVAILAATFSFELVQHCSNAGLMPTVLIWGSEDAVFPSQGYAIANPDGTFRSSFSYNQTRSYMNTRFLCAGNSPSSVNTDASRYVVQRELLTGCGSGVPAAIYTILGASHRYPDRVAFTLLDGTDVDKIEMSYFEFFNNIRRPDVPNPLAESTQESSD